MRSLTLKLTLAFLIVSLIGAGLTSLVIRQRTGAEFNRFLFRQGTGELVTALSEHYTATGSWDGCEKIIAAFLAERLAEIPPGLQSGGQQPGSPVNGGPVTGDNPPRRSFTSQAIMLADADGSIVCGPEARIGARLTRTNLRRGLPIEVDGRVVGTLLAGDGFDANRPLSPELAFLQQINRVIGLGALASIGVALLLGGLLASTLTRPLREMTAATEVIAQGKLGYQVPVRSQDELGRLATAFNRMSADLAHSTQMRKQMTADVAHDLRTPLSLILGYTEALSDGKLPGDPEIYTVMHREAEHLNHLIDDLRLLSLADAGELPLTCMAMPAAELLQRAAAAFRPQAAQRDIALRVDAPAALPQVDVDPERMAQVLGNLLANALRYTTEGDEIVLSAAAQDDAVLLQVRDTGRGIAGDDLPHIFDRFYRADKSRSETGESGLGLTIARSLVEAHGGSISVESAPAQGAVFTIRLPAATGSQ